jgi:hypothetical protein
MTISVIYLVTFHPIIFRLRVIFSKKIILENNFYFQEKSIFRIFKRNYSGQKIAFG